MVDESLPTRGEASALEVVRVLALLDASRHSLAALAAAVNLASSRHAELVALYVEDLELLTCAAFPFSCEIGAQSGVTRPLSTESLEASIAHQLQRVHQALDAAVAGHDLRHRLEVSRGMVATEALAKAGPGDVLVLGKAGTTERWGTRLGSTSRRMLLEATCTVLVWDEHHPFQRGPLRLLTQRQAPIDTRAVPDWLAGLFDGIAALPIRHARELEQRLAHAKTGGLLLHRPELAQLLEEDPELLNRVPLPIVVVE
ncbi:universal stress protein [Billgrantia endophytica]|nr:universal stress protein [Halomonas endophytica]